MPQATVSINSLFSYWRTVYYANDPLVIANGLPIAPPSYFDFKMSGSGYDGSVWRDAWCLNPYINVTAFDASFSGEIYSSYESSLLPPDNSLAYPTVVGDPANLAGINWLLNQNYTASNTYNYGEVQSAIWTLLGFPTRTTGIDITGGSLVNPLVVSLANVTTIVNSATQHNDFVPDNNEYIGVILSPSSASGQLFQPMITPVLAAKLGDYVWNDLDANGIQDSGESGIAGAVVKLVRDMNSDGDFLDANEVLATTTTDASGHYVFKGLTPGLDYTVLFEKPAGYDAVSPFQVGGAAAANNSDGLQSATVTLAPGQYNDTIDSGFYKYASLGDRLWVDSNGDGKQDANHTTEPGIVGRTVTLTSGGADGVIGSGGDDTTTTTLTGADGVYAFTGLTPGVQYQVTFGDKPAGSVFTTQNVSSNGFDSVDSDASTSTGKTQAVTLVQGENNTTLDAGVYTPASLGDKVWLDCDRDGVQDNGEAGVANVTVKLIGGGADGLINGSGDTSATTTTNASGNYAFTGLTPGVQYQVQFTPLSGYSFTTRDAGGNDATDSDADLVSGKTQMVTLNSGNNTTTFDAGLTPACRPVTFDFSGSSALDGSDGNSRTFVDALTGVSVTARAFSQDKHADNTPTNTWQTAWLGSYSGGLGVTDSSEGSGGGNTHTVDNVGRNNYVVLQFSQDVTVDKTYLGYVVGDSDVQVWIGNSASTITTMSNSVLTSMGFSEVNTTTASTARWADLNAGGAHGNVLIIAADTTDCTPDDYFKVQQVAVCAPDYCTPVAKASIGDFVWEDKNTNGVQDSGEAGVCNVTVNLLNSSGSIVATTTTDGSGHYGFSNLTPADYKVQVIAPSGYFVTVQDRGGNDTTDSDINGSGSTSGTTILTTLSAGENDPSWDAGLYRKALVGDKVWDDMNHNNLQDASESGIGGIRVKLMGAGADGIFCTADDTTATTTTTSNGNYQFANLNPGTYKLEFDKANVQYYQYSQWNNMSNWKWAVKDTGSNDGIDSDVAGNAIATTNVTQTDAFTLKSGDNDLSHDAGITPIVIDLDGNGIHTVSRANSGGSFDLFGDGSRVQSGWISGSDAFLAVDKNGNGKIDNISELFGGTAKGAGFAQLASYDSNGDGLVSAADTGYAELKIWRDANGNHQTDAGELMTLAQAGVSELITGYQNLPFLDAQGNVHLERSSATMTDGHTVDMTDVYFNVAVADAAAAGVTLPGMGELLNDVAAWHAPVTDPGWLFA